MFPVTVSLKTDAEVQLVQTMYDNQRQRADELATQLNCQANVVRDRLETARQEAGEHNRIQFADTLDADLCAEVIFDEYQTTEQASVTTTFTATEQEQLRAGLERMQTICSRITDAMADEWAGLSEVGERGIQQYHQS